jgi:hypothetical protein
MSLETIVNKMIAANEPESNIAKVIKYHKKDSSKINCKKCNHSWKVADGGNDLYMCHECGYNNNKSPLKAIKCPEGFIDNEDGLGCVEEVNIEAVKRNKLDKNYAREMSSQAPEAFEAKDNIVSNTREEILERRKKCPEGFEKVDGKCVEKGIIATEQLEDVEIVADKVDPEVKKVAKEQAYEYNIENTTLGRVNDKARNYKPTEEDINNFVATSVDYRQQQQNFKAENKSTIFNKRLKETIAGLLEKAELFDPAGKDPKIVQANKKAEQASGTYVDPTGILEAREVYLKTGEWPLSKQQAAELNKKVDLDLEEAQEEFDSKIPESVKKYNESAEYNSPEAKQEREEVKQNEMFNEMVVDRLRSGAKNNETVQQTYQNLVDEDEGGKKVKERYQQNHEVQEILNVKRKELQEKFNIKQAYQDVYKTVQSEEKDRINKFADKAYRDVKIGYVNSDGAMVATVPTKGIQWEDRKKEADDKINLYIQQLAEKSIQNNPTIAGYNDAMTVFNQEQFQNFASQDTEYLEGINKYKTALERGVNIVNSEKEAKVREINIEALSRTTNIPKEVLPAVASVSSFVFTQGAGLVDFAEKFGYAPLAAIMKTTGFMGSSPNGLSLSENFENIARENNVDLSEVYKAADALATLKPKYYDKDGIPQDGLDLALSGDYKKAAEVLVNEAIGSGPSLALSIAFPVAGSLMLGMSTAGSGLEDDLVRRPKETLEKIYSANLLKGTFETGMEYLGAKSFRLINSMKTAGKSAQQVREMMNPIINLGVKSTLAGVGEGGTELLTNVGQEGTDWLVYDDEKEASAVLHNSINAGLVGFILGKGATAVSVGSQISEQKSLAFQALAPLQWKGEMRKIEEQIVEEQGSLDENSSKVKRERV